MTSMFYVRSFSIDFWVVFFKGFSKIKKPPKKELPFSTFLYEYASTRYPYNVYYFNFSVIRFSVLFYYWFMLIFSKIRSGHPFVNIYFSPFINTCTDIFRF
jgi:hypothetical protein